LPAAFTPKSKLLEGSGALVTWNDRIDDPDNPGQGRQIDVTIRRDGAQTLVECRMHRAPQDVKWIEELMGRRTSLQASGAIAVSASGFTEGARRKAQRYGIFLRELDALTETEVESWGIKLVMTVYYYQFENLRLVLVFSPAWRPETGRRDSCGKHQQQPPTPSVVQRSCGPAP
jgi:Restriction endonuclease